MAGVFKQNMNLFGLPYQFTPTCDPRYSNVSDKVGRRFMRNIYSEAPICTIIPGKPKYLPAVKSKQDKKSTAVALLSGNGGFNSIKKYLNKPGDDLRLYDFERAYTEYMSYVNILCRTGAVFLELNQKIGGVSLDRYDWRNYRNDGTEYASTSSKVANTFIDKIKSALSGGSSKGKSGFLYESDDSEDSGSWEEALTNTNFVQFYVDPEIQSNENVTNTTGESMLKSALNSGSDTMKELSFIMNSGGLDAEKLQEFADGLGDNISAALDSVTGGGELTGALSRIVNLSGNVVKGENIAIPDVYQNSKLNRSYSITVHLRSPYGTKFGYYMDIYVPLMHLLALALPKQTTANTFSSPFLVKIYVDGLYTCNLGMVTNLSINKVVESRTVDGLPAEVDVSLEITDLYSDLTMSPQTDPLLFVNNTSLVEYLASNCGMSLISPNSQKKLEMTLNTASNSISDIGANIQSLITDATDKLFNQFTNLTW